MQNHFTDTIFYQIELTAKYYRLLGHQVFEQYNAKVNPEEFSILDTLLCNTQLCQRDLAKIILKDRANTGKLLDNLEKRGYLVRRLSIKNNRPVKIVEITPEGERVANETTEAIRPHLKVVRDRIKNSDLAKISDLLRELREFLDDTLEIQI